MDNLNSPYSTHPIISYEWQQNAPDLYKMPPDIIVTIFSYLALKDFGRLGQVSTYFEKMAVSVFDHLNCSSVYEINNLFVELINLEKNENCEMIIQEKDREIIAEKADNLRESAYKFINLTKRLINVAESKSTIMNNIKKARTWLELKDLNKVFKKSKITFQIFKKMSFVINLENSHKTFFSNHQIFHKYIYLSLSVFIEQCFEKKLGKEDFINMIEFLPEKNAYIVYIIDFLKTDNKRLSSEEKIKILNGVKECQDLDRDSLNFFSKISRSLIEDNYSWEALKIGNIIPLSEKPWFFCNFLQDYLSTGNQDDQLEQACVDKIIESVEDLLIKRQKGKQPEEQSDQSLTEQIDKIKKLIEDLVVQFPAIKKRIWEEDKIVHPKLIDLAIQIVSLLPPEDFQAMLGSMIRRLTFNDCFNTAVEIIKKCRFMIENADEMIQELQDRQRQTKVQIRVACTRKPEL